MVGSIGESAGQFGFLRNGVNFEHYRGEMNQRNPHSTKCDIYGSLRKTSVYTHVVVHLKQQTGTFDLNTNIVSN